MKVDGSEVTLAVDHGCPVYASRKDRASDQGEQMVFADSSVERRRKLQVARDLRKQENIKLRQGLIHSTAA